MAKDKKIEEREARFTVAVGFKGTGKSIETIKLCYTTVLGVPAKGIPARNVLIYDINNEFSNFKWVDGKYHTIKRIAIADIKRFSQQQNKEIRRIAPMDDKNRPLSDDQKIEVLRIILKNFRRGVLVVEDINEYVGDHMPRTFIGALATGRHKEIDVFCHFQSIGRIGNHKLMAQCNMLRIHYTMDSVEKHADKFEDRIDILSIAQNIVIDRYKNGIEAHEYGGNGNPKDRFYFVYVDFVASKIKGNFTETEAREAIYKYIDTYYGRVVGRFTKRRNRVTGQLLYSPQQAYHAAAEELFHTYFMTNKKLQNPVRKTAVKANKDKMDKEEAQVIDNESDDVTEE